MENRTEQELRSLQLCFVGKIIAGFTHEAKNHIAIVKESAGLMGDILKLGKKGNPDSDQFLEIIGSVEDQIEKMLEQFTHLNRFAHRMDQPRVSFKVNESLEDLIALISRFARQNKLSIEKNFQKDLPPIISDPALFQLLVFCFLEDAMARLDANGKIVLQTSLSEGKIFVGIVSLGNLVDSEKRLCPDETQAHIIKRLNCSVAKDDGKTVIALVSLS